MPRHTIIHLSDLHIGQHDYEQDRVRLIFNYVSQTHPKSPVIITGDLTDSATELQFKRVRSLLNKLAKTNPVLVVPGNHDYAWKGNILRAGAWDNWVRYLGSPLGWNRSEKPWMEMDHEPKGVSGLGVWKRGKLVYIGIDSGDPNGKEVSARGYISKDLAKELKKVLMKYKECIRVVFLHHHPFTRDFFTKLHGARRLMGALSKNCEMLLFGHEHKFGVWWDSNGIPMVAASHKSTNYAYDHEFQINVIDIRKSRTSKVELHYNLELVM